MKVIHYIPSLDIGSGGTTTYIRLLGEELGKMSELHIVSHRSEHPAAVRNCTVHYIGKDILYGMRHDWKGILDRIHPDIVHVNCCWLPSCALIQKWSQNAGYKTVLSPHGMLEPWIMARHHWTRKVPALWLYQKKAVEKADYIHATSETESTNLLELGYNDKIAVIPNGINVSEIPMKSDWRRTKKILFLSRIHEKKGIEFLLRAAAKLRDRLYGYEITIAGDGAPDYISRLKQYAESLGIGSMTDFCGNVTGESKWKLFMSSDVFVLPTYSENFGIAVAEALACGIPVITTKGTPWHELETRKCGWWTEIGEKATAEAMEKFLACTENELEEMGRNGRKLIEEKYSSLNMAGKMLGLYMKLDQ